MITMTEERLPGDRLERAAEDCRQNLLADPGDPAALHQLGRLARETGQHQEAVDLILRSLQRDPENVPAICDLAEVLKEMGRLEESADFFRAALEAEPRDAELHVKLGKVLAAAGQWEEARTCQQKAAKLNPQSAAAHGNLGLAQQTLGFLDLAIASYRQAKRIFPGSEQIMANLGGCLVQANRHEEAIEVLSRGVLKFPNSAGAFSNLAAAYTAVGRISEALQAAWRAVEINPDSAPALNNLGNALKAQGEYAQAIGCFAKARKIQPDCYIAYNNLGTTLGELGRSAEALEGLRRARALCPHSLAVFSNYLLTLNYQPGVSRETLLAEHRRFGEQCAAAFPGPPEAHRNSSEPRRRLRLGYVSADLRDHPVTNFFEPMLAWHASADFEVFCYANQRVSDAVTDRLRRLVPHWRNVASLTDADFAAQIRRDQIDILVDLSGHTAGNRLPVFARQPAPIQVSMIGYMQTTGLSAMDYRITDEKIDPSGTSDAFSTEKLVRLAHGAATFQPPGDCPPVNALPALRGGVITFASFNNLAKLTPETLAAWAKILQTVPAAKLLLVSRSGHGVAGEFAALGIPADRLEFLERLPMRGYLELHHRVDVLLDTFPYNGGTTSLIAAWMGVPFVSLAGADPASRTGSSLLSALGLSEMIATDTDDYVRRAVAAVSDLPRLAGWRATLRDRLAPLLDTGAGFTAEFEGALRKMWCQWCAPRC